MLSMLIRMPVELHTVSGDVCVYIYIYIELLVYLGLKPNKIHFYTTHIICV